MADVTDLEIPWFAWVIGGLVILLGISVEGGYRQLRAQTKEWRKELVDREARIEELERALDAEKALLLKPNGLHAYLQGTHANPCVACLWLKFCERLLALSKQKPPQGDEIAELSQDARSMLTDGLADYPKAQAVLRYLLGHPEQEPQEPQVEQCNCGMGCRPYLGCRYVEPREPCAECGGDGFVECAEHSTP